MKKLFVLLSLFALTLSCNEDIDLTSFEDGTYSGVFFRSTPYTKTLPVDIVITIDNNTFEGTSNSGSFAPSICRGTFEIQGDEIEFFNQCAFTANFDWTYILGGKYKLSADSEGIRITKDYGNGTMDNYILKRNPEK